LTSVSVVISPLGVVRKCYGYSERWLAEGKSLRTQSLPVTWRTLESKMMEGYDREKCLKRYTYPVPNHLGLSIGEVPYVLKTYEAMLEETLFNVETMQHGCFFFGEQKPPPGGECGRLDWIGT